MSYVYYPLNTGSLFLFKCVNKKTNTLTCNKDNNQTVCTHLKTLACLMIILLTYATKHLISVTKQMDHNQSILPKGKSFTANSGTEAAFLLKGRSSTANWGAKVAVLLRINRCSSIPLLSAPHSLFRIWTELERSEKIPGAPTWRWGEWIWLTGPSGLHRNSPQRLNISSIRVLTRWEIRKFQSHFSP